MNKKGENIKLFNYILIFALACLLGCVPAQDEKNKKKPVDTEDKIEDSQVLISFSVDDNTPKIGDEISFSVTVNNLGDDNLTNVSMYVDCPLYTQFSSSSAFNGSYLSASDEWNIGTITPLNEAKLIIDCEVLSSGIGQTFTHSIISFGLDQTLVGSIGDTTENINIQNNVANLKTDLSTDTTGAVQEQILQYTLNVENLGPDLAIEPSLTFKCPSGTSFVSDTPDNNTSYNSTTGLWSLEDLAFNQSKNLLINCKVESSSGTVSASTSTANALSIDFDSSGDNLSSTTTIYTSCGGTFTSSTTYNAYGDGQSESSAYEIGHAFQLKDLRDNGIDDWDKKFKLCNDIDMSVLGEELALGNTTTYFSGSLYGNNKTISNLNFDNPLISHGTGDMTIKDLTIANSNPSCTSHYCGFLIGLFADGTKLTIDNITISSDSSITTSYSYAASILGYGLRVPEINISNVTNNANVTANSYSGSNNSSSYSAGIIGYLSSVGANLSNLVNNGNIQTDGNFVSGIAARVDLEYPSSFNSLSNTGSVTNIQTGFNTSYLGGVWGYFNLKDGTGEVLVSDIETSGDITTGGVSYVDYVGGIAGYMGGQDDIDFLTMSNIHTAAGVTIDNLTSEIGNYTGGLFGLLTASNTDNGTFTNSSSRATVRGTNYTGGIAGRINHNWKITNIDSYGDVLSNGTYVGGFAGYIGQFNQVTDSIFHGSSVTGRSVVGGFVGWTGDCSGCEGTTSIDNAHVLNASVNSTHGPVAGFAAYAYESTSIKNSSVTLSAISGGDGNHHGGFIGYAHGRTTGTPTFSNNHVYAAGVTISSSYPLPNYVSGFIGRALAGVFTITNSTTNLNVDGSSYSGGFIGSFESEVSQTTSRSRIINSSSSGNVNCSNDYCGGFIGQLKAYGVVQSSSSTGDMTSSLSASGVADYHGGFVGYILGNALIKNSHSKGDVIGYADYASGFAAYVSQEADIMDSYVENSTIKGTQHVSGFISFLYCRQAGASSGDKKCEIKRNYVKTENIEDIFDGTDPTDMHSAGFISYFRTGTDDITVEVEQNFTDFETLKAKGYSGGFMSYLIPYGPNATVTQSIYIRKNFVKGGSIQAYPSSITKIYGGFFALVDDDSATKRATYYFEDNYTNANIDLSLLTSTAGGNVGGFVGLHDFYDNAYYKRNYTTTNSIDGNSIISYTGGFIGSETTNAAGSTEPTFEDNFTTMSNLEGAVTGTDLFLGRILGSTPSMLNNYYSSTIACTGSLCNGANGGSAAASSSFLGSMTNPPLNNWDFSTIWKARPGKYPKLRCPGSATMNFCNEWNEAQP